MTALLSPYPKLQFFDDNGNPLAGGLLYSYVAGTSTPLATYTSANGTVANANPVVLDSAGRAQVWLSVGKTYKLILKQKTGALVWTVDTLGGESASLVVDSVAALRALGENAATMVSVLGYYTPGDFGGGTFYWDFACNDNDDRGVVVKPNNYSGIGRWKRIVGSDINVKEFGAKGDNAADDTSAFVSAGVYASAHNKSVSITTGNYLLSYNPGITASVNFGSGAVVKWTDFPLSLQPNFVDCEQHFNGMGSATVAFTGTNDILPEWFGAKGDASRTANNAGTDDTDTIQQAITSVAAGQAVVFTSNKKYRCGTLVLTAGSILRGSAPVNIESKSYKKNLLLHESDLSVDITPPNGTTQYQATLEFCGTAGNDFITLFNSGAGGLKGTKISNLVIDGNCSAARLIGLDTAESLIENCLLRNAANGICFYGNTEYSGNNRVTGCTFYGLTTAGVYNMGAMSVSGFIENNLFYNCQYGIKFDNARNWIVVKNRLQACSTSCIKLTGSEYMVNENILEDIVSTGIEIVNNSARTASVFSNLITAFSHNTVTGIEVSTSVSGSVHIVGNILFAISTVVTDGFGIRTINAGAIMPGEIANNVVTGFPTNYEVTDNGTMFMYADSGNVLQTSLKGIVGALWGIRTGTGFPGITARRGELYIRTDENTLEHSQTYVKTTDTGNGGWELLVTTGNGLSLSADGAMKLRLGNNTYIIGDNANAKLAVFRDTQLGSNADDYSLIKTDGGMPEAITPLWIRRYLLRKSNGGTVSTAVVHDCLSKTAGNNSPGINTRSWHERDYTTGNQVWGNDSTTLMSLDGDTGKLTVAGSVAAGSLTLGDGTSTLKFSGLTDFDIRVSKDCFSTEVTGTLKYQKTSGVTTIRMPEMMGTNPGSANKMFRIFPAVKVSNQNLCTSATWVSGSFTIGITIEFIVPENLPVIISDTIDVKNHANSYHAICTVSYYTGTTMRASVSYTSQNGDIPTIVDVKLCSALDGVSTNNKLYVGTGLDGAYTVINAKILLAKTDNPYDTWITATTVSYSPTMGILTYTPSAYGTDSKAVIASSSNRFSDVDIMLQFPFECINDGTDPDEISVLVKGKSSTTGDAEVGKKPGSIQISRKYIDVGILSLAMTSGSWATGSGCIQYNEWMGSTSVAKGIYAQTISIIDAVD